MDSDKKKDYIRTALIAGLFLLFAIIILDMLLTIAMEPPKHF